MGYDGHGPIFALVAPFNNLSQCANHTGTCVWAYQIAGKPVHGQALIYHLKLTNISVNTMTLDFHKKKWDVEKTLECAVDVTCVSHVHKPRPPTMDHVHDPYGVGVSIRTLGHFHVVYNG